jgi:Protein of unknown function (DUF3137)
MENVKDFDSFYTIKIQPYLHEFDRMEQAAANWKKFTMVTGMSAVICFILFHLKKFPSGGMLAAALLLMCITGIYFFTKYADSYIDDFKEKIIGQIISYIHPGTVYKPMGFVSKKEYKASGLYRRKFTHFDGDDYWESVINGVSFHCSEIEASYSDPAGSECIFKGLFFTVKLNALLSGGTYIWTKDNVQLPCSIADEHYKMFYLPGVKKYQTTDPGFNHIYAVYTTNVAEASVLLTHSMLEHMLLIRQKLKKEIVFSFVGNRCYVAVPFSENLLEPTPKGIRDKMAIRNYFYTILLVFNIIKKLELDKIR